MTRTEFEKFEQSIEQEQFLGECSDPITYGIARAAFDQEKYRKLIAAVQELDSEYKSAWSKLEVWSSQLEKATRSQAQLERLQTELRPQPGSKTHRATQALNAFQACPSADCGSD